MATKHLPAACQNQITQLVEARAASKDFSKDYDSIVKKFMDVGLQGKKPNVFQMYNEYTINAMLSGTGTPVVNFASNMGQVVIRPLLELIKGVITLNPRAFRQASAMLESMFDGWVTDAKFFNRAFKSGIPFDFDITPKNLGLTQKQFNEMMSDAGIAVDPLTGRVPPELASKLLSDSYDYMTQAIPTKFGGRIIRVPTRLTVAIDEYFKARLRSQKALALISEKASLDAEKGIGSYSDLYKQYKRVWSEGDSESYANNLRQIFGDESTAIFDVRNYARDNTFQTQLPKWLQKISDWKGEGSGPLQTLLVQAIPFLRTPWNLAVQGASYVPIAGYFARGVETKTALKQLADGTKRMVTEPVRMSREDALARQVVGFGASMAVWAMFDKGMITGAYPLDPDRRQTMIDAGIPEFSIKVGDNWVSYKKMEPIATVLGIASDILSLDEHLKKEGFYDRTDDEGLSLAKEATKGLWQSFKSNLLQKTFMEGFSELVSGFDTTDPEGLANFGRNIGSRVVPALSATVGKAFDPYERETIGIVERIKARIPGVRESLPIKYGAYGASKQESAIGELTGFNITPMSTEQQQFMAKIGAGMSRPSKKMGKVQMSNEQYARYNFYINEITTNMLNNMDLEGLAKSPQRKIIKKEIEKMMSKARSYAKDMLQRDYPELASAIQEQKLFDLGLQQ